MTSDQISVTELPPAMAGFDLTDQERFAAGFPYELFARLRREAPVFFHPPGQSADGDGFWVFTTHADIAMAAASDPHQYSAQGGGSRQGGGSHLDDLPLGVYAGVFLPMMDDPRHALIKKLFGGAMRLSEANAAALRAEAAGLAAEALDQPTVNAATLAERYAARSIALLLGVPRPDWPLVESWARQVCGFADRRTGKADAAAAQVFADIQGYARELLDDRHRRPRGDVSTVLACADLDLDTGQPPLSPAERELNFLHLLMTGIEQPRNTIAAGLGGFAAFPGQWRGLRADRSLLPGAVEEILRWAPPNPYNRRTATRDSVVRGAQVRASDKVTLWWPSANRDEVVFRAPEVFDIRRAPNPHLTFGSGTHYCTGDHFARLQIKVMLEALLGRTAEIADAGPVTWAPNNKHSVVLDLPLRLEAAVD
jgi:cytochrome P450